jgi:hypothetical protein
MAGRDARAPGVRLASKLIVLVTKLIVLAVKLIVLVVKLIVLVVKLIVLATKLIVLVAKLIVLATKLIVLVAKLIVPASILMRIDAGTISFVAMFIGFAPLFKGIYSPASCKRRGVKSPTRTSFCARAMKASISGIVRGSAAERLR